MLPVPTAHPLKQEVLSYRGSNGSTQSEVDVTTRLTVETLILKALTLSLALEWEKNFVFIFAFICGIQETHSYLSRAKSLETWDILLKRSAHSNQHLTQKVLREYDWVGGCSGSKGRKDPSWRGSCVLIFRQTSYWSPTSYREPVGGQQVDRGVRNMAWEKPQGIGSLNKLQRVSKMFQELLAKMEA